MFSARESRYCSRLAEAGLYSIRLTNKCWSLRHPASIPRITYAPSFYDMESRRRFIARTESLPAWRNHAIASSSGDTAQTIKAPPSLLGWRHTTHSQSAPTQGEHWELCQRQPIMDRHTLDLRRGLGEPDRSAPTVDGRRGEDMYVWSAQIGVCHDKFTMAEWGVLVVHRIPCPEAGRKIDGGLCPSTTFALGHRVVLWLYPVEPCRGLVRDGGGMDGWADYGVARDLP